MVTDAPNNLDGGFDKVKYWVDSTTPSDLPSFPACFALLNETATAYQDASLFMLTIGRKGSSGGEPAGGHEPHTGPQGQTS